MEKTEHDFKTIKYSTVYIILYSILYFRNILGASLFNFHALSSITGICMLAVSSFLFSRSYTMRELLAGTVIGILGISIFLTNRNYLCIANLILIYAARDVDIKKLSRACFCIINVALTFIAFFCLAGAVSNVEVDGGYAIGFSNPNQTAFFFCMAAILYIYINYEKLSKSCAWLYVFTILIIGEVITNSRAIYLIFIALVVFYVFSRVVLKMGKTTTKINYAVIFAIIAAFLICAILLYAKTTVFVPINILLTGRLEQANYYLSKYGSLPFGTYIPELNGENHWPWFTIDCAYGSLLIIQGWLFTGLFLICMYISIAYYQNKNDEAAALVLLLCGIYMIIENNCIQATYAPCLLLIAKAIESLLNNRKGKKRYRLKI